MSDDDIPLDYQWINWEHLHTYVGRVMMQDHTPMMTTKVARYLERQAKDMKRAAEKLELAAKVMRAGGGT